MALVQGLFLYLLYWCYAGAHWSSLPLWELHVQVQTKHKETEAQIVIHYIFILYIHVFLKNRENHKMRNTHPASSANSCISESTWFWNTRRWLLSLHWLWTEQNKLITVNVSCHDLHLYAFTVTDLKIKGHRSGQRPKVCLAGAQKSIITCGVVSVVVLLMVSSIWAVCTSNVSNWCSNLSMRPEI